MVGWWRRRGTARTTGSSAGGCRRRPLSPPSHRFRASSCRRRWGSTLHACCYVGHSMGAHGAWVGAVQGSAHALGVAAVAGWTTKEGYGDSNFLWRQSSSDVGASHVEPALKGLLEAAIAENDVELHALNPRSGRRAFVFRLALERTRTQLYSAVLEPCIPAGTQPARRAAPHPRRLGRHGVHPGPSRQLRAPPRRFTRCRL